MITIKTLIRDYKTKKKSPLEVITQYLKVSKKQNAKLNAYTTITEETAIKQAKKIKSFNKPLSGIPIAVKDNFCTQGIRTTASAKLLDDFVPPYDATVIKRLKDAGAIILGKTNLDAWAHGSSTETSDYGPTLNPFDYKRVPGGSSGGSAAVVAAGICPFAIGSETAGSIRVPASWCGVVGVKPNYGRVSRYGVIAMGSSLDSPGPLTKTVEDSAIILKVLAGKHPYDATTIQESVPDFPNKLNSKDKYTIGVPEDYLKGVSKEITNKFFEVLKILKKQGHKIKKINLINPKYAISVYTILQRAEVSSNLARYDGIRFGQPRTYFSEQAKRRMMLGAFVLSVGYYDAYYLKAQKVRTLIINDLKKAFTQVDLIAAPTTPVTALRLGESSKNPMFGEIMDALVEASSIAGVPGISIPIGLDNHSLPIGMQIFGPWFKEIHILSLAYQLEQNIDFYNIKPVNYYEM